MAELRPLALDVQLYRIFSQFKAHGAIHDLPQRAFFRHDPARDLSVRFHGQRAATPLGPAAGPHTQLAQNIVLAWLAGGRTMELKTVQVDDRLTIPRPCIHAPNVGYNVEWSQELRLEDSLAEYVRALMLLEILKRENVLGVDDPVAAGEAIFDVSVGYDLAGIRGEAMTRWLRSALDCRAVVDRLRDEIPRDHRAWRALDFPSRLSNSITLSTFHGCPAGEIERICEHLMGELGFHVVVKMNPTMLGRERVEHLLHERLGYRDIVVNAAAYEAGISFEVAQAMCERLSAFAEARGLGFGVKFSNTLEVMNAGAYLPATEQIQYLSGPPLHVLAMHLVAQWREAFPDMPVSFSAGIDRHNFPEAVACGLLPVTTCTDLLRQGGYARLPKYLESLGAEMGKHDAVNIEEFIIRRAGIEHASETPPSARTLQHAVLLNTRAAAQRLADDPRYAQPKNAAAPRKIGRELALYDCLNCDKCIPVCPNDANFAWQTQPADVPAQRFVVRAGALEREAAGRFVVAQAHQIANFADACNECGNCDVFCPEDGGPHLRKPRFFSSRESFASDGGPGFHVARDGRRIEGRIEGALYTLALEAGRAVFSNGRIEAELDPATREPRHARLLASAADGDALDLRHGHTLFALLDGVRADGNFVSAP
jgi:putative selenate reductase